MSSDISMLNLNLPVTTSKNLRGQLLSEAGTYRLSEEFDLNSVQDITGLIDFLEERKRYLMIKDSIQAVKQKYPDFSKYDVEDLFLIYDRATYRHMSLFVVGHTRGALMIPTMIKKFIASVYLEFDMKEHPEKYSKIPDEDIDDKFLDEEDDDIEELPEENLEELPDDDILSDDITKEDDDPITDLPDENVKDLGVDDITEKDIAESENQVFNFDLDSDGGSQDNIKSEACNTTSLSPAEDNVIESEMCQENPGSPEDTVTQSDSEPIQERDSMCC